LTACGRLSAKQALSSLPSAPDDWARIAVTLADRNGLDPELVG